MDQSSLDNLQKKVCRLRQDLTVVSRLNLDANVVKRLLGEGSCDPAVLPTVVTMLTDAVAFSHSSKLNMFEDFDDDTVAAVLLYWLSQNDQTIAQSIDQANKLSKISNNAERLVVLSQQAVRWAASSTGGAAIRRLHTHCVLPGCHPNYGAFRTHHPTEDLRIPNCWMLHNRGKILLYPVVRSDGFVERWNEDMAQELRVGNPLHGLRVHTFHRALSAPVHASSIRDAAPQRVLNAELCVETTGANSWQCRARLYYIAMPPPLLGCNVDNKNKKSAIAQFRWRTRTFFLGIVQRDGEHVDATVFGDAVETAGPGHCFARDNYERRHPLRHLLVHSAPNFQTFVGAVACGDIHNYITTCAVSDTPQKNAHLERYADSYIQMLNAAKLGSSGALVRYAQAQPTSALQRYAKRKVAESLENRIKTWINSMPQRDHRVGTPTARKRNAAMGPDADDDHDMCNDLLHEQWLKKFEQGATEMIEASHQSGRQSATLLVQRQLFEHGL